MASADRWTGSRQRWSGIRARPIQRRQNRVVALSRAPAAVAIDIPIELPSPRNHIATRALPAYLDYRARLLAQLFADEGLRSAEAA